METRTLMTTFVYGKDYQDYIPLLSLSLNNAYPQYDIKIFVHGLLQESVKEKLNGFKVEIVENAFDEITNMSPLIAKSLRWVLWDDSFMNYDYLYTLDIDMLYAPEPSPLHIQHATHCSYLGLPFSNVIRDVTWKRWSLVNIAVRLKRCGLKGWRKYFFHRINEKKLTGLHFVKVKPYYKVVTPEVIEKYRKAICTGKIFRQIMVPNNEVILWHMVSSCFDLDQLCVGARDSELLNFTNFSTPCFRPHHGIHLGLFRIFEKEGDYQPWMREILDSKEYNHYVSSMSTCMLDELREIQQESGRLLSSQLRGFFDYYQL